MKLCWDNIENIRLTKKGNFRDYARKKTYYYHEHCEYCGEPFLSDELTKHCSKKCGYNNKEIKKIQIEKVKKLWKDPNSTYNSKEYRNILSEKTKNNRNDINSTYNTEEYKEKHRESVKLVVNDPNGVYKSEEFKEKQRRLKKEQWKDPNSTFNTKEYKKKQKDAVKLATNTKEFKEKISKATKKMWEDPNSKFHTKEFKEKHKKAIKRATNSKEHKKKISGKNSANWKGGYRQDNIPTYDTFAHQLEWCEKVRRNEQDPNVLEVKCFKCGEWFIPKLNILFNRLQILKGNDNYRGEQRFYCSDECKYSCSIYGKTPETLMKEDAVKSGRLNWIELGREVQGQLRQMVLERDNNECQKCGEINDLHCHHILPVNIEPLLSVDIDNCITLCYNCHKEVHKKDGCKYNQLNMEEC